ncbi:MAG: MFS transporter [Nitrospiraceae bacterium]|nr:MFS transporter [Nitrospiraceae bacterium]
MRKMSNLLAFTMVNSIWGVVYGMIGPFYAIYVAKISGGLEKVGFSFSIMILVQAASSYYVGRYSDRLGRRPFLFAAAYMDAVILFCYTMADQAYQIYILQGLLGITNAVNMTIRGSLLADITQADSRGLEIGRFNALVSIFTAGGFTLGGFMAKDFGLQSIFYFGAVTIACSTVLLFFVHEPGGAD